MNAIYRIEDTSSIFSPALLFYKDLIRKNIDLAVKMAGGPQRLRPHAKTHKTREVARMELDAGITKHKCATLAEAEMLAACGTPDVLIAYPMVGPNCRRLARLMDAYPRCRFSVLADHPAGVKQLSEAMAAAGKTVDVFLDLDVGQHRTGIAAGDAAATLYEQIAKSPGLRAAGFHVYDGHNHQESLAEREEAVERLMRPVLSLRSAVEAKGLPVPSVVAGGTPTFPVWARMNLPGLECSPGTFFLNDHGYGSKFADLSGFVPAALLLTRVVSRPTPTRLTLDLGYKAVSADQPAGKRVVLLNVPDYQAVIHNEEHLVVETPAADRFQPGDEVFGIPAHVCPTCALHQSAYVVEGGKVVGTWDIASRDRVLTV